jgi:hypothetical protein
MRNAHNEGPHINYNNTVTQDIDAQKIIAPQYGIVGTPPKFDPPPQKPRPRKGNGYLRTNRNKASVLRLRTKDLKVCIAILEAELNLAGAGKLPLSANAKSAMEARLGVMRWEKTRRDLRDLAAGKTAPTKKFFSIGARLARVA